MKAEEFINEVLKEGVESYSQEELDDAKALFEKAYQENINLKEAAGIDEELLEGLYGYACRLYERNQFDEALQMFQTLHTLTPNQAKYALGVAACLHMQKDFENAGNAYSIVSLIDPENPFPYYHAADCYLSLENYVVALEFLDQSLKATRNKKEYAKLKSRIEVTIISAEQKKEEAESLGKYRKKQGAKDG